MTNYASKFEHLVKPRLDLDADCVYNNMFFLGQEFADVLMVEHGSLAALNLHLLTTGFLTNNRENWPIICQWNESWASITDEIPRMGFHVLLNMNTTINNFCNRVTHFDFKHVQLGILWPIIQTFNHNPLITSDKVIYSQKFATEYTKRYRVWSPCLC